MNAKNKTKKQLLGQGSYGCVYRPAFKCSASNNNSLYENKVSKVILNSDANDEIKQYLEIDKIDPEGKFHIRLENKCDLSEDNKEELLKTDECDIMKRKDNYKILTFNYGGKELSLFRDNIKNNKKIDIKSIYKFLISYYNLIYGAKIMVSNNFCHFDIKDGNIVYDTNKNTMKLIDFGLAIDYNYEISKNYNSFFDVHKNFFLTKYTAYPPELLLGYKKNFTTLYYNKDNINKIRKQLKKNFKDYNEYKNYYKEYNYMLKDEYIQYYSTLIHNIYNNINSKYPTNSQNKNMYYTHKLIMKLIFNKLDLYSLVMILKKYFNLFKEISANMKKNEQLKFNELNEIINVLINNGLNGKINDRWSINKVNKYYKEKIYTYCINNMK